MRAGAQPRRWERFQRIVAPAVVVPAVIVAVVAVAGVVGARAWFDTRDELDRTTSSFRETRGELADARVELDSAIAHLRAERAAVHAGLATLDTREGERDAADGALTTAKNQLAELRVELEAATADLADREAQLDGLDRCVRGVVEGLNQAAVGDLAGLDATLAGIEDTCASAGARL